MLVGLNLDGVTDARVGTGHQKAGVGDGFWGVGLRWITGTQCIRLYERMRSSDPAFEN